MIRKLLCWLGKHEYILNCDLWNKQFRCKLVGYPRCQEWCSEYKLKCKHCGKGKR